MVHGTSPLSETDPELYDLIKQEKHRQISRLDLIASVNYSSRAVMQAAGSCLIDTNCKGLKEARYNNTDYDNPVERLCVKRALEAFGLNESEWGANVQPYSGTFANFSVYTGLLKPHDRIMGLNVSDGGHLTHGFMTEERRVSAVSIFFETMPYCVDPITGIINYEKLQDQVRDFRPRMLIAGASGYPREIDYKRMREIADITGAWLVADMAHIGGLVSARVISSPFPYCDVVTTTANKTLRGIKAGIIFFRRGVREVPGKEPVPYNIEKDLNFAVWPTVQGAPHHNSTAAIATSLKEANTEEFREYQQQTVANARSLSETLQKKGYKVVSGGTDNHIVIMDLRPCGIGGDRVDKTLDICDIIVNKYPVPGDRDAVGPGGIRLGSPALTSREFIEDDFETVAHFIHEGIEIAKSVQEKQETKQLAEFEEILHNDKEVSEKTEKLKQRVSKFASSFPLPGHKNL